MLSAFDVVRLMVFWLWSGSCKRRFCLFVLYTRVRAETDRAVDSVLSYR